MDRLQRQSRNALQYKAGELWEIFSKQVVWAWLNLMTKAPAFCHECRFVNRMGPVLIYRFPGLGLLCTIAVHGHQRSTCRQENISFKYWLERNPKDTMGRRKKFLWLSKILSKRQSQMLSAWIEKGNEKRFEWFDSLKYCPFITTFWGQYFIRFVGQEIESLKPGRSVLFLKHYSVFHRCREQYNKRRLWMACKCNWYWEWQNSDPRRIGNSCASLWNHERFDLV